MDLRHGAIGAVKLLTITWEALFYKWACEGGRLREPGKIFIGLRDCLHHSGVGVIPLCLVQPAPTKAIRLGARDEKKELRCNPER